MNMAFCSSFPSYLASSFHFSFNFFKYCLIFSVASWQKMLHAVEDVPALLYLFVRCCLRHTDP